LEAYGFHTAEAWRAKEMLRWVRKAKTVHGARWRLTHFIRHLQSTLKQTPILGPVFNALETVIRHKGKIIARWNSGHSNARLEAACFKQPEQEPVGTETTKHSLP